MKYKLILPLLICQTALAQIKIGNLTVPDSIAKEYFIDIYSNCDTLYEDNVAKYYPKDEVFSEKDFEWAKIKVDAYNQKLHRENVGVIRDTVWYWDYPKRPSYLLDTISWLPRCRGCEETQLQYKKRMEYLKGLPKRNEEWEQEHISERKRSYYISWTKYLMPRLASQEDFIKWYNKAHP